MLGEWFAFKFFVQHISNSLYLRKKTTMELEQEGIYDDEELEGGDVDFEKSKQKEQSGNRKAESQKQHAINFDKKSTKKKKKKKSRKKNGRSSSSSEPEVIGEPLELEDFVTTTPIKKSVTKSKDSKKDMNKVK